MKNSIIIGAICAFVCLFVSCATLPQNIPESLSANELIQAAQEASDVNNYDAAVVYYQTALSRFPSDMQVVCASEYEIAFIQYKKGQTELAVQGFRALLARYESPDAALLPGQYKVLAEKVLSVITAKSREE